jgi:hypothetical protein
MPIALQHLSWVESPSTQRVSFPGRVKTPMLTNALSECENQKKFSVAVRDDEQRSLLIMITHALLESSSGYGLFEVKLTEDIGAHTEAAQSSIKDLSKFGKMVSLMSFVPFKNAAHALENANDISEGVF